MCSDDELLALVHQLQAAADLDTLRRALAARKQADPAAIDSRYVAERLERLRRAGLTCLVRGTPAPHDGVRLTAAGVERLQALQREPLSPEIE